MNGIIKRVICAVTDGYEGNHFWAVLDSEPVVELMEACVDKGELPSVVDISGDYELDNLAVLVTDNLPLVENLADFPYAAYIDGEQSPVIYVVLS
jgi:hypothetical protein